METLIEHQKSSKSLRDMQSGWLWIIQTLSFSGFPSALSVALQRSIKLIFESVSRNGWKKMSQHMMSGSRCSMSHHSCVSAHSLHCHQMHMIYDHSNSNAINYHTWTLIDAQICFCFPPRLRRRFSQIFIDIREKERKRLQRGLVSVPLKYPKLDEKLLSELTANDTDESTAVNRDDNPSSGFKPEHLLELQEKITKEILGTRLKESEMHELQVSTDAHWCEILSRNILNFSSCLFYCIAGKNQSRNPEFKSVQFG